MIPYWRSMVTYPASGTKGYWNPPLPPQQYATYNQVPDDGVVLLVVLYTAGIMQNHSFLDGNKQTGFVLGVLFLELNGFGFNAPEEYATAAVFALASGEMDEQQRARFLTDHMTYLNA